MLGCDSLRRKGSFVSRTFSLTRLLTYAPMSSPGRIVDIEWPRTRAVCEGRRPLFSARAPFFQHDGRASVRRLYVKLSYYDDRSVTPFSSRDPDSSQTARGNCSASGEILTANRTRDSRTFRHSSWRNKVIPNERHEKGSSRYLSKQIAQNMQQSRGFPRTEYVWQTRRSPQSSRRVLFVIHLRVSARGIEIFISNCEYSVRCLRKCLRRTL